MSTSAASATLSGCNMKTPTYKRKIKNRLHGGSCSQYSYNNVRIFLSGAMLVECTKCLRYRAIQPAPITRREIGQLYEADLQRLMKRGM